MKKATIARFVIGGAAIFAAFGLAACGAETGAPEAEGVGQTSEALITATGREGAASCVIHDAVNNKDLILTAGGYNASGAVSTVEIYEPGTGWTITAASLNTARAFAKALPIPGNSGKCIVFGGQTDYDTSPAALASWEIYDFASNTWTVADTVHGGTNLATARSHFDAAPCGTSKILAIGGQSGGSYLGSMEVFNFNAAHPEQSTWTALKDGSNNTVSLGTTRAFLGAYAVSSSKVVAVLGENGGGSLADSEAIPVNSSCVTTGALVSASLPSGDVLSRFAGTLIAPTTATAPLSTNDKILVTTGTDDQVNARTLSYRYNASTDVWHTAAAPTTARAFGTISRNGTGASSAPLYTLIGGSDKPAIFVASPTALSIGQKQTYNADTNTWATQSAMTDARYGQIQETVGTTSYATLGSKWASVGAPPVRTQTFPVTVE